MARAFRAMDCSGEGIALLGDDGEFIYVNQPYAEITGNVGDDLIGVFWEQVYPEGQVKQIYDEILPDVLEIGFWTGTTVYQRKDGDRILVDHAIAYSDEGTMICLIRDGTDAESRRQALQAERQRFDPFIEAVEDYTIYMPDPDGYIRSWNIGAERRKGYTENEILGEPFSICYPNDAKEKNLPSQLPEQALEHGSVQHTRPGVPKDGSTFNANGVITTIYNERGTRRGFGKVTQDQTESVQPTNHR